MTLFHGFCLLKIVFSAEIQKKKIIFFVLGNQFAGDFSSNLDEFLLKFSRT